MNSQKVEIKEKKSKKTVGKLLGKILKNKIGRIICIVLVAAIVLAVVAVCSYEPEQSLDTTYIIAKLEKSSELATAKLKCTGMSEFKDSGIAFISKSDFIMVYEATARAGIDVELPLMKMKYDDAINKYGSDKPDLRNPLIIEDLTDILSKMDFQPFKDTTIRGIKVESIDKSNSWFKSMEEYIKSVFE